MSLHFLTGGGSAPRSADDGAQQEQRRQGAAFLHFQRHPPPGQWGGDLFEQANHYTGTIYLALSRVSQTWASARAVLERRARRDRTTFGPGGAVAVVKAVSNEGGAGNDEDYAPVHDHPVAHRLAEANPTESFGAMLGYMALQQGLTGEAPVWFVPNCDGKPVELYALPRALMQPQPASAQYPDGYWRVTPYLAGGTMWAFGTLGSRLVASTTLPGREVQRLMAPHALTRQAGWSALTACAVQVDIDESINLARHSHMQQAMTPGAVVYLPNMDEGGVIRATEDLKAKYAGARQHRKPMVVTTPPGGDGKPMVSQLTPSAIELDFVESLKFTVNFVAAALDVPPGVLGIADADSYAKAYAVRQEMHDRQSGRLKGVADFFTRHLCGPWSKKPGEYRCKITLPPVVNKERDRLSAAEMAQHGIVLVNELRRMHDMQPINGGDLPPAVFAKWVEQKAIPQPAPQAVPGMDAGAMPPPVEGAQQPGEQPGAEQAPEQGGDDADMDAVTQAALEALGVGGAPEQGAEQKALRISSPHKSGVFSDARGRKYRIQDGKRVPLGGATPPPVPNVPKTPAKPAASTGWVKPAAPGADVDHDALAKQVLAGRPKVRFLLPNMQGHDVTDGASLREFFAKGGRIGSGPQTEVGKPRPPEQVDEGKAKQAASALQLQNPAVLDHLHKWASTQADKHADRLAAHFGIDRARAHKLLVSAIQKIAEHYRAGKGGWGDNTRVTIRDTRSGKTAGIAPKGGTPVNPPRPSNPAGRGSLPPRPSVAKAMGTLDDSAGGFLVQPGARRKRVRPGFEAFLKALCDQRS